MNAKKLMEEVSKPLAPKLCKDCQWFRLKWIDRLIFGGTRFGTCAHPRLAVNVVHYDLVCNTKPLISYEPAVIQRQDYGPFTDTCGPAGKYWEKK